MIKREGKIIRAGFFPFVFSSFARGITSYADDNFRVGNFVRVPLTRAATRENDRRGDADAVSLLCEKRSRRALSRVCESPKIR